MVTNQKSVVLLLFIAAFLPILKPCAPHLSW